MSLWVKFNWEPLWADIQLEQRIREVGIRWIEATKRRAPVADRYALFLEHRDLVEKRSPEQIERMERERGLR